MQPNPRPPAPPAVSSAFEHIEDVTDSSLQTILSRLQTEAETNPAVFRRISFAQGQKFISQGEHDTIVYILVDGEARVSKIDEQGVSHDLSAVTSPTIVGELSALAHGRTANVTATTKVEAIALEASVLRDLCAIYADFARSFAALVHQRLAESDRKTEHSASEDEMSVLAQMQALAFATSQDQREIIGSLIALAREQPHLLRRERHSADSRHAFIEQGQALDHVYVIVEGEAEIHLPNSRIVPVGPGSLLGEIAALSTTHLATVAVFLTKDAELLSVPSEKFRTLRGSAEKLVRERVNTMFAQPLPPAVKETLRSIRDQNTDALILRTALDIVHSATGIYKDFNPEEIQPGDVRAQAKGWSRIRQKCALIQSVASMLKLGQTRSDISRIVHEIRGYGLIGVPALKMFKGEAALLREDWVENVASIYKPYLPHALSLEEFTAIRERFEAIQWLDQLLLWDGAIARSFLPEKEMLEKFRLFLEARESDSPARIFDEIDDMFVELMEAGLTRGSARVSDDLMTVKFQKVGAKLADNAALLEQELPPAHANYQALRETRERLGRGERSAIGGADYATQRFPPALLRRIVAGEIQVVVFDGTRTAGTSYVAQRAASSHVAGIQPKYMTTEMQGLDGGGGRTLMTFAGGKEQVLLLTGYGAARQRHNADSILLYELGGKRVPAENLILASEQISYRERMRTDLQRALEVEGQRSSILGEPVESASLPTMLLMLQNPKEFAAAHPETDRPAVELVHASGAMFDFYIGYRRNSKGTIERYIIPKTGGKGLYGDTAGDFVEACFSAGIGNLQRDVIFNGTAGGFGKLESDRGAGTDSPFGKVVPGESIICPLISIADYEGKGKLARMDMVTLFGELENARPREPASLALFEKLDAAVCFTSDHVSVGAPGDETFNLIAEMEGIGFTSIDVEGGAIMKAIEKLNSGKSKGESITFTPFYTFSDNPLRSKDDRYDSLAIMGPFFEGSRLNAKLWEVLKAVLDFCSSTSAAGVKA